MPENEQNDTLSGEELTKILRSYGRVLTRKSSAPPKVPQKPEAWIKSSKPPGGKLNSPKDLEK